MNRIRLTARQSRKLQDLILERRADIESNAMSYPARADQLSEVLGFHITQYHFTGACKVLDVTPKCSIERKEEAASLFSDQFVKDMQLYISRIEEAQNARSRLLEKQFEGLDLRVKSLETSVTRLLSELGITKTLPDAAGLAAGMGLSKRGG